jgi:hypothetical protein
MTLRADAAGNRSATKPTDEIEITPEMIEAGELVIWRGLLGSLLHPSCDPGALAKSVFVAMADPSLKTDRECGTTPTRACKS